MAEHLYTNLFESTARYYARFRDEYPKTFIDHLVQYYKLDDSGRLFDLGCGTGQLTVPLAEYFQEGIGVDPDKDMLEEAKATALKAKVSNLRWVHAYAEDVGKDLGTFRLTTIGTALHWMDQEAVVKQTYERTEPGGGLVVASIGSKMPWSDHASVPEWKRKVKEVIQRFLGPDRRAGDGLYKKHPSTFEEVFHNSPFGGFEMYHDQWEEMRDIDFVVGHVFSTSWGNRNLFKDAVDDFERTLRKELLALEPTGKFREIVFLKSYLMRK